MLMLVCSFSSGFEIGTERNGPPLCSLPGFLDGASLKGFWRFVALAPPHTAVTGFQAFGANYFAVRPDDLPHDDERRGRRVAIFKASESSYDGLLHCFESLASRARNRASNSNASSVDMNIPTISAI